MVAYTSIATGDWDDQTKWNDGASGFPGTGKESGNPARSSR